jgi:MFS family permease
VTAAADGSAGGRRSALWTALAGFAFFVVMLGTTLPTPLYPALEARFGFGELTTTIVFAVYPIGVTAALLGCGHWSDQVGRRPMLVAGLALSALSAALFLVPGSMAWVYAGRLVSGLSAGIFTGTATAAIGDLAAGASGALVAAAVNMGGLGSGPLVAGLLASWAPHPLRLPFVLDLALIVVAVVGVALLPETVRRADTLHLGPQRIHVPAEMRQVFARAAIGGFAGFAVLGLVTAVSPAFLGQVLHRHSPALVGVVACSVFAASIVGQVISTKLSTATGQSVGCGLLIVGMLVLGPSLVAASLPLLVIGALVAGVGQGLSFRAGLASIGEASPPDQRGAISSAFFVALYVGISLPVVGFGSLSTAAGLVTAGLVFTAMVGLLAAVVLVLLVRSQRTA